MQSLHHERPFWIGSVVEPSKTIVLITVLTTTPWFMRCLTDRSGGVVVIAPETIDPPALITRVHLVKQTPSARSIRQLGGEAGHEVKWRAHKKRAIG
jgi:hypothetical protein